MRLLFICLLVLVGNVVQAKAKVPAVVLEEGSLNVVFNEENPVVFVGKKSVDAGAQAGANIMYPGDTAGVFLVSIFVHAAISGSVEQKRLSREQEEANKVLEPFADKIALINTDFIWDGARFQPGESGLEQYTFLLGDQQAESSRWQLRSAPVFAMTQSQKSFIVYNKLTFTDRALAATKKKPKKLKRGAVNPNEKLVVIVSDPVLDESAGDYWLRNDAQAFTAAVKDLYMESFQLGVVRQFKVATKGKLAQVTIRYLEDGVKKIERGYVISQTCKRTVFESLANEIKSVPNLEYSSCLPS